MYEWVSKLVRRVGKNKRATVWDAYRMWTLDWDERKMNEENRWWNAGDGLKITMITMITMMV
ncbi:hypothetical protein MJO28_004212 [Puccinia striiformis f. sp. tritici]|uniref:Uncharacterized protein n=1 Tax=Puccinia striiformis f. sp. tritici TaxID=168172 RepID=A0ACC0ERT1_9BASI|nr:hypothetical protein MJO28_004212 [Puccinia striiformis f. sp. tritici]